MTIQEVIRKAVEGGYSNVGIKMGSNGFRLALLDPSFWQALSKSMGWGIEPSGSIWQGEEKWKIRWHRLIDHLASGKSIEDYFKNL